MMRWLVPLMVVVLTACNPAVAIEMPVDGQAEVVALVSEKADYPDLGPAPELVGDVWLNIDHPVSLSGLRGKVTLLDMWTFG